MNRLMNALPARISFLTMVFLTSFRAQILYETDYQQYSNLNREGKEVSVQSLLGETEALLKKETSDLQKLVDIKEDAYNDLMMIYSQGKIPNGKKLIFLKCSYKMKYFICVFGSGICILRCGMEILILFISEIVLNSHRNCIDLNVCHDLYPTLHVFVKG